jgi:hypothetical protein
MFEDVYPFICFTDVLVSVIRTALPRTLLQTRDFPAKIGRNENEADAAFKC